MTLTPRPMQPGFTSIMMYHIEGRTHLGQSRPSVQKCDCDSQAGERVPLPMSTLVTHSIHKNVFMVLGACYCLTHEKVINVAL